MTFVLSCIFGVLLYIASQITRIASAIEKLGRGTDGGTNG